MNSDNSAPLQWQCTLWVHDDTFSKRPVVLNPAVLVGYDYRLATLFKVVPAAEGIAVQDFQAKDEQSSAAHSDGPSQTEDVSSEVPQPTGHLETPESARRQFVFNSEEVDQDYLTKHPNLQISVCTPIARLYGFSNRMNVTVTLANEAIYAATHVELTFRDMYLTRADMRRLAASELWQKTLYRGQELLFLASVRATVRSIYVDGEKVKSAMFTPNTRPIFRSESARFVLYIQMSKEMWEFEATCSGDIVAERVINRFLPELFQRWSDLKAHHAISIVLFTRMEVDSVPGSSLTLPVTGEDTSRSISYRDYYRVVCSAMSSSEAPAIIHQLKQEFREFLKDASTVEAGYLDGEGRSQSRLVLSGTPSSAQNGNILEAINLVTTQYAEDYMDRDLVRTGLSVMVISPGTGIFEVDENILQLTTDNIAHNGIGIDLVCLSPRPLHVTPLFRYKKAANNSLDLHATYDNRRPWSPAALDTARGDPMMRISNLTDMVRPHGDARSLDDDKPSIDEDWTYAQPHWLEIHYFKDRSDPRLKTHAFIPRISMYEVQMSGKQELDMSLITIPFLSDSHPHLVSQAEPQGNNAFAWLDQYDEERFQRTKPSSRVDKPDTIRRSTLGRKSIAQPRHVADIFSSPTSRNSIPQHDVRQTKSSRASRDLPEQAVRAGESSTVPRSTSNVKHDRAPSVETTGSVRKQPVARTPASKPLMMGMRGFSFNKATAVTAQSTAASTPTKERKADMISSSVEPSRSTNKVTDRVKSSLARYPSSTKETSPRASSPVTPGSTHEDVPEVAHDRPASAASAVSAPKGPISPPVAISSTPRNRARFESVGTVIRQKSQVGTSASNSEYSPWLTIVNPCRPSTTFDAAKQYRRWHHLYPRFSETSAMKWKSLCSPASLPLTTSFFPTVEELEDHYTEGSHRVLVDDSDQPSVTRAKLLNELISFRLSKGFQVVQGQVAAGLYTSTTHLNIFDERTMVDEGVTVIMSKGDSIHVLCCEHVDIQVMKYYRRLNTARMSSTSQASRNLLTYKPFLRTTFADDYNQHTLHFSLMPEQYNWSAVDQYISSERTEQLDYPESLDFWRARFVFIPVPPPRDPRRLASLAEDTDDEIRIEGIQRITQIWDRNRYHASNTKSHHAQRHDADPNPLRLDMQTRDASAVAASGFHGAPFLPQARPDTTVSTFSQTDLDLHKLAHALQIDPSIKLVDRRWYLKTHLSCFVGSELITWLLHVVKDLTTREEAVKLGEQLMERGLFKHVRGRHNFRDGNFFYSLSGEYREHRGDSRMSWFGKRSDKSVPSTPAFMPTTMLDHLKDIPSLDLHSISADHDPSSRPESSADKPPPSFEISGMMEYDVDPRRRSKRPEIIKLHYSMLYNPETCFPFRIEWLDCNPKLIEDAITHWASTAEKYGHRLVQLPLAEAHKISQTIPFRSPYLITMSAPPPEPTTSRLFDHTTNTPLPPGTASTTSSTLANPPKPPPRHLYQRALLKRFHFVLEQEAAANFPAHMHITFTWGRNDYRYNQFIHRSGHCLAQIDEEGRLLFVINRLHDYRAAVVVGKEPGGREGGGGGGGVGGGGGGVGGVGGAGGGEGAGTSRPGSAAAGRTRTTTTTPYASPALSALTHSPSPTTSPASNNTTNSTHHTNRNSTTTSAHPSPLIPPSSTATLPVTAQALLSGHTFASAAISENPEIVIRAIEAFCADEAALGAFWEEVEAKEAVAASVRGTPVLGAVDAGRSKGQGQGHGGMEGFVL